MNFTEMFKENYSYFLNEINYKVITVGNINDKVDIKIQDNLEFKILGDTALQIIANRAVRFNPNVVYELNVSFGAILEFKSKGLVDDNVDWNANFVQTPEGSTIIQSLLTRVSLQIAQITSSYGLNPIVTPPNLMN